MSVTCRDNGNPILPWSLDVLLGHHGCHGPRDHTWIYLRGSLGPPQPTVGHIPVHLNSFLSFYLRYFVMWVEFLRGDLAPSFLFLLKMFRC